MWMQILTATTVATTVALVVSWLCRRRTQLKVQNLQEREANLNHIIQQLEQKETDYRYEAAIQMTNDGLFEFYLEKDEMIISKKIGQWLGTDQTLIHQAASQIIDRISPEDWKRIPKGFIPDNFDQLRASIRDLHGQIIRLETRYLPVGGDQYRWALITVKVDVQGKHTLLFGSFQDIHDQKMAASTIEQLSTYDITTGLRNFSSFINTIEALPYEDHQYAVVLLNMDNFRTINAVMGYFSGNDILKIVATTLVDTLPEGCQLFRFGADEFVLLIEDGDQAERITTDIQRQIRQISENHTVAMQLSACAGITLFNSAKEHNVETLMREMDIAVNAAKRIGKDRYAIFNASMEQQLKQKEVMIQKLKKAVKEETLEVFYQPQVNMNTNEINRAEALLRWNDGTHKIPTDQFVQLAEETGLIVPIGRQVLRKVCQQMTQWEAEAMELEVSVNISPVELRHPEFSTQLRAILHETRVDPSRLTLEITETSVLEDIQYVQEVLSELKAIGVQLSLDDFGTGYSSLSHLINLPIDEVKLDRSFIRDIHKDQKRKNIVRSFIDLAKTNGLRIIAEGIETEYEAAELLLYGCRYAQGYLYAKALPADQVKEANKRLSSTALTIESVRQKKSFVDVS